MNCTFDVTVGARDDAPGCVAVLDDLPEFVGQGEDEDAAMDDLLEQINALTWH